MGCSVSKLRISTTLVALGFILAGCKSSTPQFGIPEDERTGFFSRHGFEERAKKRNLKWKEWQHREKKRHEDLFDLMKGQD